MSDIDLSSWEDFWDSFHLPIYMSLIGAVIGHYREKWSDSYAHHRHNF